MERYSSLVNLRQRLRILCGYQSSDQLSGQLTERHNEFLRGAHEEVQLARKWASTTKETEFTFEPQQREYTYPVNCGPQDIQEMGCWSGVNSDGTPNTATGQYLPVFKRQIPLQLNIEPTRVAGDDTLASLLARPTRWMPRRTGFIVFPVPDKQYLARVTFRENGDLVNNSDYTVVDSLCTLWIACADELEKIKNYPASERMRKKAQDRLVLLSAWEIEGHEIPMDPECTFSMDRIPNFSMPRDIIENPLPG